MVIALLNQTDPIPLIEKQLHTTEEVMRTLLDRYRGETRKEAEIRYDYMEINKNLQSAMKKLSPKKSRSWITPSSPLSTIEELTEELFLLTGQDCLSLRAKALGAFLLIELYRDEELLTKPELQKEMVQRASLLESGEFAERKATITKAMQELANYNPSLVRGNEFARQRNRLKRKETIDIKLLNRLYAYLQEGELSWQAKGLFLYVFIYEPMDFLYVFVLCPNSNIGAANMELQLYIDGQHTSD